jgi:peptide/nickel transport system substrate-binding protein
MPKLPRLRGRELVATDVQWFYKDYMSNPLVGQSDLGVIDSITCPDKYTVVFHTSQPRTPDYLTSFQSIYYQKVGISPPELGRAGVQTWQGQLGTGPFMLTDYVEGSAATYVKNPDYWGYDQNYPQNRLPYVDRVEMLCVTDPSTQLAAIRTGKADLINEYFGTSVDETTEKSLVATAPGLIVKQYLGRPLKFAINCLKAPFTDMTVRQAMNMAIDQNTIIKD